MSTHDLYKALNDVNHTRENRSYYANLVIDNPNLISKILDIVFMVNDKISCRAAWVLEFGCAQNLDLIVPHIDYFTKNIDNIHLDSAVRPVSKICKFIAKSYFSKTDNIFNTALQPKHQERIIEACFDWMISDQKVAVKAYSMSTLFLFGKQYDWIYPELIQILEQDYPKQSPAYKARARQILKKVKTK